ncbi:ABC transporter permease [Microbacterium sp. JZ31]|uniref:ABC transporter permease n=1 Tax=Microbacterium sp. JZ31 TaxID=1906274 RepID=UPI001EE3B273|nr:ABC transporter permease [Microbacterium sp. JZ31]
MSTATSIGPQGSPRRYVHSLWLLSARDLKVKYATSWLGYLWSILDPLLMCLIYWFVFTQVFPRHGGEEPFVLFLIAGLLPWQWFASAVGDSTSALTKDQKLVTSTGIPNTIWVLRVTLTTGLSFVFALPVLAAFAVMTGAHVNAGLLWFPVAMLIQAVLVTGIGLFLAPLCVLISDLGRTTRLIIRVLFYGSPILYTPDLLPESASWIQFVNPMFGVLSLYRVGFFPSQWNPAATISSILVGFIILVLGAIVFRPLMRPVLKDL